MKLAVACGRIVFALVGNQESSHYLMTGDPIYAIKQAESKSSAGEIVITARVSRHISANEYLLNIFPDGLHAKVTYLKRLRKGSEYMQFFVICSLLCINYLFIAVGGNIDYCSSEESEKINNYYGYFNVHRSLVLALTGEIHNDNLKTQVTFFKIYIPAVKKR